MISTAHPKPALATMQEFYRENYRSGDKDFRIEAFKDNDRIIVKVYKIVEQKTEVIPQFEASLRVAIADHVNISELRMFQKLIKASKLFLQNFQD